MNSSRTESTTPSNRGPFSLLQEVEEAEEVLILTYAANLDFFERFALGQARSIQAATSVISDAAMVMADPAAVGRAGLRYLEARAVCPGRTAFHPKLLVIASRKEATVAIGSGNLTLAGWHGNEELWTVVKADHERGPSTIREVSSFLRSLAEGPVELSAQAPQALTDVALVLDSLNADEPGPRLVSSLGGPIIDQLPEGPVDELVVYAPFHDARFRALDALNERLAPERLTVHVQAQTSVDGAALETWLQEHGADVRWCSDKRYRHGKLIEWRIADQREALTGSPNLSAGALLRGIRAQPDSDGDKTSGAPANLELGSITRIESSLAPPIVDPPRDGFNDLRFRSDPADTDGPSVLLLGATLTEASSVELRLASELDETSRVQIHDAIQDWTSIASDELPPGERSYLISSDELSAGRALRLIGAWGTSNEVFVSDPRRARRRPFKRVGPHVGDPTQLVEDGDLKALFEIAELMRPELLRLGALVPRSTPRRPSDDPSGDERTEDSRVERLEPTAGQTLSDYLAACAAVLDETSVEWALALPSLPGIAEDSLEARGGILTTETDDSSADAGKKPAETTSSKSFAKTVRALSDRRRRQLRKFCEKAVTMMPNWPNLMRAYTARLVLTGIAADLWKSQDERRELLGELVEALWAPGDEPTEEERKALAAYAAVALAVMRLEIEQLSIATEPTLQFRAAANTARPILLYLEPDRLESVLQELETDSHVTLTAVDVESLAEDVRNPPSGPGAAITLLRNEHAIEAHSEDGVVVVDDLLPPSFERELLRITGVIEGPRAAVAGRTRTGDQVLCAWEQPRLVLARRTKAGFGGRLYELGHSTPAGIAANWDYGGGMTDNLPRYSAGWFPGKPMPEAVAEVLRATGLEPLVATSNPALPVD